MPDIENQRNHFNSIAEQYTTERKSIQHKLVKQATWDIFFKKAPLPNKSSLMVLEAMCGEADGYEILKNHCTSFTYEAFDYSESMVELAKKKLPDLNIFVADITTFSETNKYDIIILIGGLHHVYHYKEIAIQNMSQALKDNGILINYEPTHNNFIYRKIRERIYNKNKLFDETTEKGFSTNELNSLMLSANLIPRTQLYPGLLAYVLWYNPDAFPMLNRGSAMFVKSILALERKLYSTGFARYFSFTTLGCYQKNHQLI